MTVNTNFDSLNYKVDSDSENILWCGESAYCNCAHHLERHSRNDEPGRGCCSIGGCPCKYFTTHEPKRLNFKHWRCGW